CWVISRSSMRALAPARPTASRAGAVTPITGRAATAPGLPYRHNLISTNGTDRSDRWVTSGSGALSAHLREQIALTVGQANECGYCIAAHSAIGQKVGLSVAELAQAWQRTTEAQKHCPSLASGSISVGESQMPMWTTCVGPVTATARPTKSWRTWL